MQNEEQKTAVKQTDTTKISLDFDGEEREYGLDEIKSFIKKSHNYEEICGDWERLKAMALIEGKSVGEYLNFLNENRLNKRRAELFEKCADPELADYILTLEAEHTETEDGFFGEVREFFPKIKNIGELPVCVVEAARLKGSRILDEWLRYRHKKQMEISAYKDSEKSAINSSIGPQSEHISADFDPTKLEFINGIWGK